jgi:hypothetical protein
MKSLRLLLLYYIVILKKFLCDYNMVFNQEENVLYTIGKKSEFYYNMMLMYHCTDAAVKNWH